MRNPEELLLPHLRGLKAYTPGTQPQGGDWIKLNTNELPFPPSPRVIEAITAELPKLALYPNPTSAPLREAIAEKHALKSDQVIVGNGSDDILNLLTKCFGGKDFKVGDTSPSYSLYPVLTAISGGKLESVSLGEDFKLPIEQLLELDPNILFLTHPNAPSGVVFPFSDIESLVKSFRGILVLDEAYVEFAKEDALPLLNKYANIVITRTFSKAYGLAGLRVGYGLADAGIISILDRVRDSYNVNRLSQAGALAALRDEPYYRVCRDRICATRERVASTFRAWDWHLYPSQTNFLFVRPARFAGVFGAEITENAFETLQENKILVRWFPSSALTAPYLRISVGTDHQMDILLDLLETWKNA